MNTDGAPILKDVSRELLFFAAYIAATALSEIRFPESELD
jgi:hypothetical protein